MTNWKIQIKEEFINWEKTHDIFKEVIFYYEWYTWKWALPKVLGYQWLDLTEDEFNRWIKKSYKQLNPKNKNEWILNSNNQWNNYNSQTYKVLKALYSGEWECRVCWPVPQVNPQAAARIRDLKKKGYIILSLRSNCALCQKKTTNDILVMLPKIETRFEDWNENRMPMSDKLKDRMKKLLWNIEVCFNIKRSPSELLIDHKFPSQRWKWKESENKDNMNEKRIREKFQLLSNQTNMWKSRYCDRCVKENKRWDYMGIKWFYKWDENWTKEKDDELWCIWCPWYDLDEWKKQLKKIID